MDLYGISPLAIAQAANVSTRTATRWKRHGVPACMQRVVLLGVHGDLAALHEDWAGWKLYRGVLWSPEGESFTPGHVRATRYQLALVRELRARMEQPAQLEPI